LFTLIKSWQANDYDHHYDHENGDDASRQNWYGHAYSIRFAADQQMPLGFQM
jgi:hypothetical protein